MFDEQQQATAKQQELRTNITNIDNTINNYNMIGGAKINEGELNKQKQSFDDELTAISANSQQIAVKLAEFEKKKTEKAQELADLEAKEKGTKNKKT